jgi:plasmid stability protein
MPSLPVPKLDDDTIARLRMRAAEHGVSMEEEVRLIIQQALATPQRAGDLAVALFSRAYGSEPLHLPERETSEPLGFDDRDERDHDRPGTRQNARRR